MKFDIVRGKISKPEQCKQLIEVVTKYMEKYEDEPTLYLGYPLTANAERAITLEALWVTKNKGMIAIIFGDNKDSVSGLQEKQDELYYNIDFYLKKYASLRKGRNLAFSPLVVTIVPNKIEQKNFDEEYIFCKNDELIQYIQDFDGFDKTIYNKLCEVLQKVSEIKPRKKRNNVKLDSSYGSVIKKIEKEIANLDQWQKKAAFEVPEGPQRIKGLAGSGKTIVLALKAAYLHTQFPELKIAVTYYTRALYQQYVNLITDFVQDMSGEKVDWDNLDILHAWGSNSEKGIYSNMCNKLGVNAYNLTSAINKFGRTNPFKGCCDELLDLVNDNFESEYDVILIDEAQDMPSSFFRLVYSNVKNPKKIVWAYDELQNLSEIEMPSLEEMFGVDENGSLNINIENIEDEPKRDITLPICYRNPPWTLALAHALGFGLYHTPIIQMFDNLEMWRDIGYTVKSGRLKENNTVLLSRKNASTPEYFEELLTREDSVKLNKFSSKQKQYAWMAREIKKNITEDELDPDDILVVFPDTLTAKKEYREFERYLVVQGVNSILAGVDTDKDTFKVKDCITCAHIYRAKGNEAPMVYIANADYCADGMELIKLRNILFTSITRSRAWVRICGCGESVDIIDKEYGDCSSNNFDLKFKIPTEKELARARKVNRERSAEEKKKVEDAKLNINDLIKQLEDGVVDPELIPELDKLMKLLGKK